MSGTKQNAHAERALQNAFLLTRITQAGNFTAKEKTIAQNLLYTKYKELEKLLYEQARV